MARLYFIQSGYYGPIKIGVSEYPNQRLASLQNAHYEELRLLLSIPGGVELERQLHEKFDEYRIRGEWFLDCAAIKDYIRDQSSAPGAHIGPQASEIGRVVSLQKVLTDGMILAPEAEKSMLQTQPEECGQSSALCRCQVGCSNQIDPFEGEHHDGLCGLCWSEGCDPR